MYAHQSKTNKQTKTTTKQQRQKLSRFATQNNLLGNFAVTDVLLSSIKHNSREITESWWP